MNARIKILGAFLVVAGLAFMSIGAFTFVQTQAGASSLQAFSAAQNVNLRYNDQGQLADSKGSTEESTKIMAMLTNEWKFPVVTADLNPNDPIVNTATEYMYQMATVSYHTLHADVTVTLPANVTAADGSVVTAGDYEFVNDGKYWATFAKDPISAAARGLVWTGTAHALIAELGVGTVTASALQMGLGLAGLAAGIGGTLLLLGFGLVWVSRSKQLIA